MTNRLRPEITPRNAWPQRRRASHNNAANRPGLCGYTIGEQEGLHDLLDTVINDNARDTERQ